ncbi:SAM hydrolase/SAM-dependent halogenase family protein [Mongoliitalea daihaiensis]|uniref:SAM hydrolase/SAM-dependent halogenase family protein n=1 Tax=Mongoliitalea daihaiensis TaxID=2782006 RepID=UPI001F3B2570|nr:SAM-dependent chlorinase/fluorinase [Mongoliitalea daihaiensis]UJP66668.1 SAM-dependent chlorinase/fluorinase [Mongoliitalea daihaiensis]
MALITFTSDFGERDFYVSAVKAKMLSINPQLIIVDISHQIDPYNTAQAAFLVKSIYKDFPKGTVHLLAMNGTAAKKDGFIAIKHEEHIFIGPNNGVLSLLSEQEPGIIVQLTDAHIQGTTFPTKDLLAPIVAKVASGAAIHDFGGPLRSIKRMIGRQFKATKQEIVGHILQIDNYGNMLTNIPKDVFDLLNPGKFTIRFGREESTVVHQSYEEVDYGDCFVLFNSLGVMEIGINQGHGADLLGLRVDSPIYINFDKE